MRTASRILGFSVGAVVLSAVLLGGTAQAAEQQAAAPNTVSSCPSNLNWDGVGPCAAVSPSN
jgi:hypothetical protein